MEKIIKRTFFKFFGPTLVASLALAVVSMTDLIVAGQLLGSSAFTAISLALPVTIFVQIIAAVFGGGAGIVLSNLLGRGEREHGNQVFTIALASAAAIGVLAAVLGLLFLDSLILLLGGQAGEGMRDARQYIGILLSGMPFLILAPVQLTFLRNDSNPRYSMFCALRIHRKKGQSPILLIPAQEEANGAAYQVLIQDKYEDIPRISEEIDNFCEAHGVPMKKRYYISLCMEELVVNVIQLGFQKEQDNYIDIRVSVLPGQQVALRIRDDAVKFDPTQSQEASLNDLMDGSHQEDHNELGLLLVKKVASSYSYKRTVGFNDFMVVL